MKRCAYLAMSMATPFFCNLSTLVAEDSLRSELDALKRDLETLKRQAPDQQQSATPLQIGAQYRVMAHASNFSWHPDTISNDEESRSFLNQRLRTWAAFSPSERVGAYLQVEFGHIGWGEDREAPKTYGGDSVGIELRRGYLRHASDDAGIFRVGIQDWHDAFGESATLGSFEAVDDYDSFGAVLANSVWDFNVAGVSWSRTFPGYADLALNAGGFVLWDADEASADETWLWAVDADVPLWGEDGGIGASLYYLDDRGGYSYPTAAPYESSWDAWIGLRAARNLGGFPLRAWAILNVGQRDENTGDDFEHTGWSGKIELHDLAVGPGILSVQAIYASGEDDPDSTDSSAFRTIAQSERDDFGSQGYWSYLTLSSPHGPSDVKDLGVGLQNRGLGLVTLQMRYGYPILGNLGGEFATGWLSAAADNPDNGERSMGVELANTFTWDLGDGLKLAFGGAYFLTGDFYQQPGSGDPDDLWQLFSRLQLEF